MRLKHQLVTAIIFFIESCTTVNNLSYEVGCASYDELMMVSPELRIVRSENVLSKIRSRQLANLYDQMICSIVFKEREIGCIPKEVELIVGINNHNLSNVKRLVIFLEESPTGGSHVELTMDPIRLGDLLLLPEVESINLR